MELPYSDTNAGLHYDLNLELDPPGQYVAVRGSVAYRSPRAHLERARFYLHHQFSVHRLDGRRVLGYHYDIFTPTGIPFLPQAAVLDVYFNPPLKNGETALIQFEYAGTLTDWPEESPNIVTNHWVELGAYLPWYPMQYDGGLSNLTFTLKAAAPAGYQIASCGYSEPVNGTWYFNWPHPTSDIVAAAGPTLNTYEFSSKPLRVLFHASTFSESAAAQLGEDVLLAFERFAGWFGPTRPLEFTIIESPRHAGGGYSRRGLVVLSGLTEPDYLEQREAYLRYLAHEAALTWWWQAPADTWEAWLNVSFAEYAALLALKERYGAGTFERFLARKSERAAGCGPLWQFQRSAGALPEAQTSVERLLYDKGPLLLHELSGRIGIARFLELGRAMLWSGVTDTAHFLDLLEEVEDPSTRAWMEERLKT